MACGCTSGARTADCPPASCLEEFQALAGEGGGFLTFIPLTSQPSQPASCALAAGTASHSPCVLSVYLHSCRLALEASGKVRSLPVCQGLVQILPRCPSFTEKAVCLKKDSHTLLDPSGTGGVPLRGSFQTVLSRNPSGDMWVPVAGGAGLTHWSSDTFP